MCVEAAFSCLRKVSKNVSFLMIFSLACASLLATGCPVSPPAVPSENMREYVHKNGLTVKLPEKFTAVETVAGFIVEPADGSNKTARYPTEARVTLQNRAPSWEHAEQRSVNGRTINYRSEKQEGGSGGPEYTFSAYEQIGDRYVTYEQREQSKDAPPPFKLCWTVIENTSVKK